MQALLESQEWHFDDIVRSARQQDRRHDGHRELARSPSNPNVPANRGSQLVIEIEGVRDPPEKSRHRMLDPRPEFGLMETEQLHDEDRQQQRVDQSLRASNGE